MSDYEKSFFENDLDEMFNIGSEANNYGVDVSGGYYDSYDE